MGRYHYSKLTVTFSLSVGDFNIPFDEIVAQFREMDQERGEKRERNVALRVNTFLFNVTFYCRVLQNVTKE